MSWILQWWLFHQPSGQVCSVCGVATGPCSYLRYHSGDLSFFLWVTVVFIGNLFYWIVISKAGILFSSPLGLPREVLDKCLQYQLNHASSVVINCFPRLTGLSLRLLYLSRSDSFHKYLAQSTYSRVENGKLFYLLCKTSRPRGKSPGNSYEKQDEIISARGDILQGCSYVEGRCPQDSPGRGQRLCWGSGHLSRRERSCRRQAGTVLGSSLAGPCVYIDCEVSCRARSLITEDF